MKSMIANYSTQKINAQLKELFVLFILFSFAAPLHAQESDDTKLHFGLHATPSFVWLKVKDPLPPALDGDGSKLGFAFGLMTEFSISKRYAFATGLDVSYRGGKTKSLIVTDLIHTTGTTDDSLRTVITSNSTLQYIE